MSVTREEHDESDWLNAMQPAPRYDEYRKLKRKVAELEADLIKSDERAVRWNTCLQMCWPLFPAEPVPGVEVNACVDVLVLTKLRHYMGELKGVRGRVAELEADKLKGLDMIRDRLDADPTTVTEAVEGLIGLYKIEFDQRTAAEARVAEMEAAVHRTAVRTEVGNAGCQEVRENVCQLCRASSFAGPVTHNPGCLLSKEGGA